MSNLSASPALTNGRTCSLEAHTAHEAPALTPHTGSRLLLARRSDERLVELVRQGDAAAFEVLYDRYHLRILSFCRHMLGSQQDGEDATQHAFVALHGHITGDDRPVDVKPWLFQVARNALVDQARLAKPQVEVPDDLAAAEPDERQPVDELDACVQSNLARLCAEDREIIEQCDLGRVRQRAFAEKHGLSLPAAKARLLRARQRLRDALVSNCSVRFDEAGRVCCHVPREGPP